MSTGDLWDALDERLRLLEALHVELTALVVALRLDRVAAAEAEQAEPDGGYI